MDPYLFGTSWGKRAVELIEPLKPLQLELEVPCVISKFPIVFSRARLGYSHVFFVFSRPSNNQRPGSFLFLVAMTGAPFVASDRS